jgi:intracellular sulfur oxidation DsrE/DsrF family protein
MTFRVSPQSADPHVTPRRGFLGRLATALLGVSAVPAIARALPATETPVDESWLRGLNGKHRQFFDMPSIRDGRPLSRVENFLDVYGAEAYGLTDQQLSIVVGFHGGGLTLALNDAMWAKYEFGRRNQVNDPLTAAPATRNPYVRKDAAYKWRGDYSIGRLQERGVRFIACMRSMRAIAQEVAPTPDAGPQVYNEFLANLVPGVTAVPAMIVATNRAQEAGLAYVYAG